MKDRAQRARCDLQDYINQQYIACDLDPIYFDQLINHTAILYSAGIDAPDFIPAGSMVNHGIWYDRSTIERGVSLAERNSIDDLMNSIMSEIQNEIPK